MTDDILQFVLDRIQRGKLRLVAHFISLDCSRVNLEPTRWQNLLSTRSHGGAILRGDIPPRAFNKAMVRGRVLPLNVFYIEQGTRTYKRPSAAG